MKTAISIPDTVFQAAERTAKRLGISRSQLYAEAVAAFVREHRYDGVTECLNRVCAELDTRVDQAVARLQAASIRRED